MPSKRIYMTIPKRDAELISYVAMRNGECAGMWCRRQVLSCLYGQLQWDTQLQDKDVELARREREELLGGR